VIDGTVNGIGARARNIGGALRTLQSGNIRSYAAWVVLGSIVVIVAMGFAEVPMNLLDILIIVPFLGFLVLLFLPKKHGHDQDGRIGDRSCGLCGITRPDRPMLHSGLNTVVTDVPGSVIRQSTITSGWTHQPVLVILSTLLTPIAMLISWNSVQDRVKEFFAFLLLLECGLIGVFVALDLFLFYTFWEICSSRCTSSLASGPRSPDLRRRQILPVHHGWFSPDAGRHRLPLQQTGSFDYPSC